MSEKDDLIEVLATLGERDEAGRHFTETCTCLDELEALGLIEIYRPIHEPTGIPYSQGYWHLTVTDAGIAAVEEWLRKRRR
jgi:hypothetical protein